MDFFPHMGVSVVTDSDLYVQELGYYGEENI